MEKILLIAREHSRSCSLQRSTNNVKIPLSFRLLHSVLWQNNVSVWVNQVVFFPTHILLVWISKCVQGFLHDSYTLQCDFSKSKWDCPICASSPLIPGPGGCRGLIVGPHFFVISFCFYSVLGSGKLPSDQRQEQQPPVPCWAAVIRDPLPPSCPRASPLTRVRELFSVLLKGKEGKQQQRGKHALVPKEDPLGWAAASLMGIKGGQTNVSGLVFMWLHVLHLYLFMWLL